MSSGPATLTPIHPPITRAVVVPTASAKAPPSRGPAQVPGPSQSLVHLTLGSIDLNLLGLEVQSAPINVSITAQSGSNGALLGNAFNTAAGSGSLGRLSDSANSILAQAVGLLNSGALSVSGINGTGPLSTGSVGTSTITTLTVAPSHFNALGVNVAIGAVQLTVTAHSGPGLVLGNALAAMSNLFNPPLPATLSLDTVNTQLQQIINGLNTAAPGIPPADSASSSAAAGVQSLYSATFPGLNLNLSGLIFQTTPVRIDAASQAGSGQLLGNVLTTLNNTLGSTPQQLATTYSDVNSILAKAVGALNSSSLVLPAGGVNALPHALRKLTHSAPIHKTAATAAATLPILDLGGGSAAAGVNAMGLQVVDTNMEVKLLAQTGSGQVLGNLLNNLASLTPTSASPAASAGRALRMLSGLSSGAAAAVGPAQVLNFTLPALDLNLLGLEVQSSPISLTIAAQSGSGEVLGNALASLSGLLSGNGIAAQLSAVTTAVGALANSGALSVAGVDTSGTLGAGATATVPIVDLTVPANQFDAMGAQVQIGTVELKLIAHSGTGLVLGNALAQVANLFNPPLPSTPSFDFVNARLQQILTDLNTAAPGFATAPVTPSKGIQPDPLLEITLPGINLNLLGMFLQTSPLSIGALPQSDNGLLLGNILATLNNTQGTTPAQLAAFYGNVNAILAKVVGVLNGSTLTLPASALSALSPALQTLAQHNASAPPSAAALIVDLSATSLPADNLMGQQFADTGMRLTLLGQTADGQILGNLLYNLANLV